MNMFPIVDAINSGLEELHRARQDATRSTRLSRENISSSKLTPTQALYKDIIDIMTTIDTQVGEAVSGSKSSKSFFLKRLSSMLGCTYDASRRPDDLSLIFCVLCRHMSIIHPPEDDGHVDRNKNTLTDYETRSAAWSKYIEDRQEAIQNSTPDVPVQVNYPVVAGRTLTRAPSKPAKSTLEQPTALCTCLANSCGNPNDDVGSSCPIRCRTFDPEDDPTFDMSDPLLLASNPFAVRIDWVQEGPKTVCSCEYCKCSCAVYYNTCDTARISHSLLQVSSTHESSGNDPAALAKFVSQQFTIAKLGWDASTAANNTRDMSSEYEEFMNMSMADGIVRSGARSNPLSSVILRGMQNDFGSSTVVTLPSGDKLDTRVITQPPNKHATNNRIPGAAQSGHQGFPTGMSSNLEIDYRYLDERYRSTTQRATSLSSIMFGTDDDAQSQKTIATTNYHQTLLGRVG